MDLEERLVLPFTTPTTCFSSSPCSAVIAQQTTKNRSFRFATENHILGVSSSHYQPVVHGSIVGRDRHPSTVICVGYAQYPATSNNSSKDEHHVGRLEALALSIGGMCFGDCIALGTFSGRCMIYRKASQYDSQNYRLLWECTLPYSVHGLELRNTENGSFDFVVLTRRSVHIFQPTSSSADSLHLPPAKYSVTTAKGTLKRMLERPPPPSPPTPPLELREEPLVETIATTAATDFIVVVDMDTSAMDMDGTGRDIEVASTTTTTTTTVLGDTLLAVESLDEWDRMTTGEPLQVVAVSDTEVSDAASNEDNRSIPEHTDSIPVGDVTPEGSPDEENESSDDQWILVDEASEETPDTNPETDEHTFPLG